jgi:hypothetical protein
MSIAIRCENLSKSYRVARGGTGAAFGSTYLATGRLTAAVQRHA